MRIFLLAAAAHAISGGRRRLLPCAAVTFALVVASAPVLAHFPIPAPKGAARRLVDKRVKNATLIDQDGKRFSLNDIRGKVVAVTFVYTKCPDVCPLFTAKFASLQRALDSRDAGAKEKSAHKPIPYLLLTITTDPDYDKPEQLKAYAEHFKPNFAKWLFLTGPSDELATLWKDFGVNVRKAADGHVQHTAVTALLDRRGVRRVEYYGDKWQERDLLEDLVSLSERDQPAQ